MSVRKVLKFGLISVLGLFVLLVCAVAARRWWVVEHRWGLVVAEPSWHGGFGEGYESEAECNKAREAFLKDGFGKRVSKCSRESFIPSEFYSR